MESTILQRWRYLQRCLFPAHEAELSPHTPLHGRLAVILDYADLDRFVDTSDPVKGRPRRCRGALAKAFLAKSLFSLPSTEALINRLKVDKALRHLCGFEPWKRLPCEATFSNAFAEFAADKIVEKIHEALVKATYKDIIVGHISRDATDIPARGKAEVKRSKRGKKKKPRLKGKQRRLSRQTTMSLEQMLDDLPRTFDIGSKSGRSWKGYKLHLDVADGGIPISAVLTSASVHDSQVAIPLEEITSQRVVSLYSLMDAAYDASEIREYVKAKDKVAIIEPLNYPSQPIILDPAERQRFKERTTVERSYSRLKDGLGARYVNVRGPAKVMAHLMFGILVLTIEQSIRAFG